MNKDDFLEIIFKLIKDSVNASAGVKITGVYFSGLDIAFSDNKDNMQVYRILIVPHNQINQTNPIT